ncbi:MAG: porin [Nitrospina sp.]|nr:porin [Nitrospina sp.]
MKKVWLCFGFMLLSALAVSTAQADMSQGELRLQAMEEKVDSLSATDNKVNYNTHKVSTTNDVRLSYGSKGFRLETGNGLFQTNLAWRAQMRFTGLEEGDPRRMGDFGPDDDVHTFETRRVRMKIGGHGYKPWIKYYFEVDLQPMADCCGGDQSRDSRTRVIDWRIDVQPWEWFGIRVGQWKINYNRERVDSSGKQQFVERSIVNRQFTIDRQIGVMAQGHLFKGTLADMRYYAGVFNGEGKGVYNPDDNFMYMGRIQWNFLGRDLKWKQSDVSRHKKPTGSLAFAAAQNNGVCTRWSSSGCGNLDEFTDEGAAAPEQFNIRQYVQEFAFKWNGLSIQEEYHWKRVHDTGQQYIRYMEGAYAQVGYFFNELVSFVPPQLEVAFRYAFVDEPDTNFDPYGNTPHYQNHRNEFTGAINWFVADHNNKITVDASLLTLDNNRTGFEDEEARVRVQWDITF